MNNRENIDDSTILDPSSRSYTQFRLRIKFLQYVSDDFETIITQLKMERFIACFTRIEAALVGVDAEMESVPDAVNAERNELNDQQTRMITATNFTCRGRRIGTASSKSRLFCRLRAQEWGIQISTSFQLTPSLRFDGECFDNMLIQRQRCADADDYGVSEEARAHNLSGAISAI